MDEMLPQDSDGDEKARAFRVSNFLLAMDEFPLSGRVDRQNSDVQQKASLEFAGDDRKVE
jgi:hypothetical protein